MFKKILTAIVFTGLISTSVHAAQFRVLHQTQVKSPTLRFLAVTLAKLHRDIIVDQSFHDEVFRARVFKIVPQKGQPYQNTLRQFTRYISYWNAVRYDVSLEKDVRFNTFIDGLFPTFGDEDASAYVMRKVDAFHRGIERVVEHRSIDYAEFSFEARPTYKNPVEYAEGWYIIDRRTGEILISYVGESMYQ